MLKSWDPVVSASVSSGKYTDFEDPAGTNTLVEENEFVIDGGIEVSGTLFNIAARGSSGFEYFKLGGDSGTLITTGGTANWLFWNSFSICAGADIALYEMPNESTTMKLFPNAKIDWALFPGVFLRASFDPGIESHSFGELFNANGLVTMATPFLLEERSSDISGEIGFKTRDGLSASVGGFSVTSTDAPVFTQTGDYFDIVKSAELEMSGFTLKSGFDRADFWGVNGEINFNEADCNNTGRAPFIPEADAQIDGYYIPHELWNIRAVMRYVGIHYIDQATTDSESSFVMIDVGVDRTLLEDYISMYVDLRNITDSDGVWWTGRYTVPGIGLYIGLKAQY
jgi:hypothetical protein